MKKIIMLLTAYTLSLTPIFSQGVWTKRDSLPATGRCGGIGFAIGKYGYMGLGGDNLPDTTFLDFWRFDPSTDTWARMADFPDSESCYTATFVIGNYGYVVTGAKGRPLKFTNRCWQYNAITNTWTQKANFPGAARDGGIGFSIGNMGYVGLGSSSLGGSDYKDFWRYDTSTNAWTQIVDFVALPRYFASGFSVGGKGYVCFGLDSTFTYHRDMWVYDTGTNTWTQKDSCYGISRNGENGFVIGSYIYVGTGQDSVGECDSGFHQYNTKTNTWEKVANFPAVKPERAGCSSFAIRDTGYFGLGEFILNPDSNPIILLNDLYEFIPDTTTDINLLKDKSEEVNVYPNPCNGKFTIVIASLASRLSLGKSGETKQSLPILNIYNVLGEKILTKTLSERQRNNIIDISNQPGGIYLLQIFDENQESTTKIIVQNH